MESGTMSDTLTVVADDKKDIETLVDKSSQQSPDTSESKSTEIDHSPKPQSSLIEKEDYKDEDISPPPKFEDISPSSKQNTISIPVPEESSSSSSNSEREKKEPNQIAMPSSKSPSTTKKYLPMEIYITLVSAFSFLCIGLMRSYTSPAIASMKEDHEFFQGNGLSKNVISWVAASPPLASFFGTILSGLSLQYCGRQKTLIILTFPFIAGWLMIGFATNISMIMTGRALTGLAAGFATASAHLYVSECVRAKVRGFLGFVPAMMLSLGILLGFAMSTINLDWKELALLMTCFPILLLLFAIAVPESPSWLMYRGKEKGAIKSLIKLRGVEDQSKGTNNGDNPYNQDGQVNEEIEKELEEMRRVMRNRHSTNLAMTETAKNTTQTDGQADKIDQEEPQDFIQFVFTDLLGKREIWFPAFVSLSLMVLQQATGANAIIYYLSLVLEEAEPKTNNGSLVAFFETQNNIGSNHKVDLHDVNVSLVIVGLVQFFAFFLSLPIIDRLGRRVLLIVSALFMIFPHLVLGLYFYIKLYPNTWIHVHNYSWQYSTIIKYTANWLPLTCLCGFMASYSIGFASIPYIVSSEICPSNARSYMCALASLVNHLTLFFIVRIFPTCMDWFGAHIVFWILAIFCLLAAIHVAIFVPETKGKSLAEIELEFMGHDRKNSRTSEMGINDKKDKTCESNAKKVITKSEPKCQCNCNH